MSLKSSAYAQHSKVFWQVAKDANTLNYMGSSTFSQLLPRTRSGLGSLSGVSPVVVSSCEGTLFFVPYRLGLCLMGLISLTTSLLACAMIVTLSSLFLSKLYSVYFFFLPHLHFFIKDFHRHY